jgi:hypothetical protein
MPGIVMRLVSHRLVDFSGLESGSQTIILARRVDASQWREGVLYLRLHNGTSISAPTTLDFGIYDDGYTAEDPAAITASNMPSFLTALQSLTDLKGKAAQEMVVINLTTPFPSMLAFAISASQGASPSTARVVISADLTLKY